MPIRRAALCSPCDGRSCLTGKITRKRLFKAKGRDYRLSGSLSIPAAKQRTSPTGTLRRSTSHRDYHQVLSDLGPKATEVSYIPGHLFPVNPFTPSGWTSCLPSTNASSRIHVQNDAIGRVGVVMVGTTCVGRMSLAFHEHVTNRKFRRRESFELAAGVPCRCGDELGMFNLGSTVVMVISNPEFKFEAGLTAGQPCGWASCSGAFEAREDRRRLVRYPRVV
ncbi:MAG: phosphatidylserine decarboxylase [bacterium]